MAMLYFEELGKAARGAEGEPEVATTNAYVETLLSSRLLNGGLPVRHFASLFSTSFNKQFAAIVRIDH
jgi:hypothetical protein